MINSTLAGDLVDVPFEQHPVFGLAMPKRCKNVPSEVLNPRSTWEDRKAYDEKARSLAKSFKKNFEQYEKLANEEIISGAPTA